MNHRADPSTRRRRAPVRVLAGAACGLLALAAAAQTTPCGGGLPKPGAPVPDNGEKFALVARHCGVLAEPGSVRRSPQLGVYDRGASLTIRAMPEAEPAAPAPDAAGSAPSAAPAAGGPARPLGRDGQRVLSLVPALTAAAREHGLDPLLLHAIAHVESRHNALAISPAGARGVMQVMPATGARFGVADADRALLNAEVNVRAGAAYLRTLRERYRGDLKLMLAAYNAGEGAVAKHNGVPPYRETQAYVRDVTAIYQRLRSEFSARPDGVLLKTAGDPS